MLDVLSFFPPFTRRAPALAGSAHG